MADPVKIIVTADTAQAAASLQQFAQGSAAGLTQLRESSMALHEGFGTLSSSALLLGSTRFPELSMGIMGLAQGMRGLRSVALLTGAGLGTILPIAGTIAVALGAVALVWHEFSSSETEAAKATKDLEDSLGKLPALLDQINTLRKAGALGPGASGEYADYLTGRKKLYKDSRGNLVQQSTEQVEVPTYYGPAPGVQVQTGTEMQSRNLPQASMSEIQAWVEKQLAGEGGLKDTREKAVAELKAFVDKAQADSLAGIEKEKAEISARYQKERDEITETMVAAGPMLEPNARAAAELALSKSRAAEQDAIAQVNAKADLEVQKAYNDYVREEAALEAEIDRLLVEDKKKALDDVVAAQEKQRDALMEQKFAVTNDPNLSESQKAAATGQILQEQIALAKTEQERLGYERELKKLEDSQTFTGNLQEAVTKLSQFNNLSKDAANLFVGALNTGVESMSQNLTQIVEGTESWRKGLQQVGQAMVTYVLQGVFKIIGSLLEEETILIVIDALKLMGGGYAEGGYTGGGGVNEIAGVVHGGEYVFPAPAVDRIGVPALQSLASGGLVGSGAGISPNMTNNKFIFVQDLHSAALEALASAAGEKVVITHITKNRMKVGIRT